MVTDCETIADHSSRNLDSIDEYHPLNANVRRWHSFLWLI